MADTRPLLLLDSGVGGLSVLRGVRALLPRAPIVYVADNGGFPYGTKAPAEIAARVPALLGRAAERYRPRLVCIACNTASTIALAAVRAVLDVPIVGTVPAIKPAALASRSRAIGVLGTDATVRQPYVDDLSARFAADCLVLRHGSARLVELAEARLRGEPTADRDYAAVLGGLLDQPGGGRVDTVVLACTHFPLLVSAFARVAPWPVSYLDPAPAIARRVDAVLGERGFPPPPPGLPAPAAGSIRFTSGRAPGAALARALAERGLRAAG